MNLFLHLYGVFIACFALILGEIDQFTPNACLKESRSRTNQECRDEQRVKMVQEWDCCDGYFQDGGNQCLQCPPNAFGHNCSQVCNCSEENTVECGSVDGICKCVPGFSGASCEESCKEWTYGPGCGYECQCHRNNTLVCNKAGGTCTCKHGYQGELCMSNCEEGWTGVNCSEVCPCQNSGECLAGGECSCSSGWMGQECTDPCPEGFWGPNCSSQCNHSLCVNGTCNRFTGTCDCHSGFQGETCEQNCGSQFWGPHCANNCDCAFNTPCDPVTGNCSCNRFQSGERCEVVSCPEGYFGSDCDEECLCSNNSTCDMITGLCNCTVVGYSGDYCNEECAYGLFGVNCSERCNCTDSDLYFCHNEHGCQLKFAASGLRSSVPVLMISSLTVSMVLLILVAAFLIALLLTRIRQRRGTVAKPPPEGYPPRNGFVNPGFEGNLQSPNGQAAGVKEIENEAVVYEAESSSVTLPVTKVRYDRRHRKQSLEHIYEDIEDSPYHYADDTFISASEQCVNEERTKNRRVSSSAATITDSWYDTTYSRPTRRPKDDVKSRSKSASNSEYNHDYAEPSEERSVSSTSVQSTLRFDHESHATSSEQSLESNALYGRMSSRESMEGQRVNSTNGLYADPYCTLYREGKAGLTSSDVSLMTSEHADTSNRLSPKVP
ncbi:uncharacterized protein LOC142338663 isoform X2 [Convolutriloba macropyga]|uniref:uncharacterized protein LOC142338663 isoform X2 n=1 Tax=Convolutriloba macropyga TaxID=536237 RepID=UPI003F524739